MYEWAQNEVRWKMTETDLVVAMIRDLGCWVLGNWDGCCCSSFSIRNVDVKINCGKGSPKGVWVGSGSMDYDEARLRPILEEVLTQVNRDSGRVPDFKGHILTKYLSTDSLEYSE